MKQMKWYCNSCKAEVTEDMDICPQCKKPLYIAKIEPTPIKPDTEQGQLVWVKPKETINYDLQKDQSNIRLHNKEKFDTGRDAVYSALIPVDDKWIDGLAWYINSIITDTTTHREVKQAIENYVVKFKNIPNTTQKNHAELIWGNQ